MFPPSPTSQTKYLALGNLGAATKPGLDKQAWKPRLREKRLKDRKRDGREGGLFLREYGYPSFDIWVVLSVDT